MRRRPARSHAQVMTMQDRTESEAAADRVVLLAVASPMLAGVVWATLSYFAWSIEYDGPEDDLATAFAFWAQVLLGLAGLIGLSVPLAIGLTARSRSSRIAAACAGAALAALGGLFWLLAAINSNLTGPAAILPYAAAGALFSPIIALVVACRPRTR